MVYIFLNINISETNNLNLLNNKNLKETTTVLEQVSKQNINEPKNLIKKSLSENSEDQTNNGFDNNTKSDEINLETGSADINKENDNDVISQLPSSTINSPIEQNYAVNNLESPSSEFNDDILSKNLSIQTPINPTKIEKEPISLMWLSLIFS